MPPVAVPIVPVGPVAVATMVFREGDLLNVVAIVKATFAFEHHGPMRPAPPDAVTTHEVHRMNNPTRSVSATSDLVPRLPGADVIVMGQAHAPGGSATQVVARLAVGQGDTTLLDKSILVMGDRKGTQIKPFRSIPIVYEKAYGGPGFRDNPLGTGVLSGDPPPNLLDPRAPGDVRGAIGFGPISRSWPARAAMVSAEVRAGLDRPIAEIPPGFDFRYFHAAPPDQRLTHLVGDEWVVLENMHPQHAVLHLTLPGAQALVRVVGPPGSAPRVFSLRADTLRVDADAERCTIVWRNSFRVAEGEIGALRLAGGVALPGASIPWPDEEMIQPVHRPAPAAPVRAAEGGTMILEDHPGKRSHLSVTMEVGDEDIESISIEGMEGDLASTAILGHTVAPPTAPLPPAQPATPPHDIRPSLLRDPQIGATLDLGALAAGGLAAPHAPRETLAPSTEALPRAATPFAQPVSPPAEGRASQPARRPPSPLAGATLDLGVMELAQARAVLPFAQGAQAGAAEPRASEPIPGSPWARGNPHALPDENAPTLEVGASGFSSAPVAPVVAAATPPPVAPPAMVAPAVQVPAQAVSPVPPPVEQASTQAVTPVPPPAAPAEQGSAQGVSPVPPPVAPQPPSPRPEAPRPEDGEDPWGRSLRGGQGAPPAEAPSATKPGARPADPGKGLKDALYRRFKKG